MKKIVQKFALLATLSLAGLSSTPTLAQSSCLSGPEIQSAVSSGQILSLSKVLRSGSPGSKPLPSPPVKVCSRGGSLYYEVAVRTSSGEAVVLVLNAKTGRP